MTEDELREAISCAWSPLIRGNSAIIPVRTFQTLRAAAEALLSRPVLPDLCDNKAIDALKAKLDADGWGISRGALIAIFRIMREPPKPRTKEVEVERWVVLDGVHVVYTTSTESDAMAFATPRCGKYTVVRLTGKATVSA